MEILLAAAAVAVGASGLYVSATFRQRTRITAGPMIDGAVGALSETMRDYDAERGRQLQELAHQMHELKSLLTAELDRVDTHLSRASDKLEAANRNTSASIGILRTELTALTRTTGELAERNEQTARMLRHTSQKTSELAESPSGCSDHERQLDLRLQGMEACLSDLDGSLRAAARDVGLGNGRMEDRLAVMSRALDDCVSTCATRWQSGRWVADQVLDMVKHVDAMMREQHEIQIFLSSRLEQEALLTTGNPDGRVITAGVYLREPAADLLWPLVSAFCGALTLMPLLTVPPSPSARLSYLLWKPNDGRTLESVLGDQLSALPGLPAVPGPGLTELQNLAAALHVSGTGSARIGPMIITRTTAALLGWVMTAAEASGIRSADLASAEAHEERLRQIDHNRAVDLTAWADALTS